jgi:hypothetical protein
MLFENQDRVRLIKSQMLLSSNLKEREMQIELKNHIK